MSHTTRRRPVFWFDPFHHPYMHNLLARCCTPQHTGAVLPRLILWHVGKKPCTNNYTPATMLCQIPTGRYGQVSGVSQILGPQARPEADLYTPQQRTWNSEMQPSIHVGKSNLPKRVKHGIL